MAALPTSAAQAASMPGAPVFGLLPQLAGASEAKAEPGPISSEIKTKSIVWSVDLLKLPLELVEQAPGQMEAMTNLLDPTIARLFAVPIVVGNVSQPLYGQPIVMKARSELVEGMTRIIKSLLEQGLKLASGQVIMPDTAPGLLLVWMYINGIIDDYLVMQLAQGDWGKALLAEPYDCLWALAWCRYFVVDETGQFFQTIERRLLTQLNKINVTPGMLTRSQILRGGLPMISKWTPAQQQSLLDGYKRYSDRCLVDGSEQVCRIARELFILQSPGDRPVILPKELQLALAYYHFSGREIAERARWAIETKHIASPEERKWFLRYLVAQLDLQGKGPQFVAHVPMIMKLADYLEPLPTDLKQRIIELKRMGFERSPAYNLNIGPVPWGYNVPGSALPESISKSTTWPSETQLRELCALDEKDRDTAVMDMLPERVRGYLGALGLATVAEDAVGVRAKRRLIIALKQCHDSGLESVIPHLL